MCLCRPQLLLLHGHHQATTLLPAIGLVPDQLLQLRDRDQPLVHAYHGVHPVPTVVMNEGQLLGVLTQSYGCLWGVEKQCLVGMLR